MIIKASIAVTAVLAIALGSEATTSDAPGIPDPASVSHIPELAWHSTPSGGSCGAMCVDQHTVAVHWAYPGTFEEVNGGLHSYAVEGLCPVKHPTCGVTEELLQVVNVMRDAIGDGDAVGLRTILETQTTGVYLAAERNAVQVIGCRGDVVAHFRLPMRMQVALTD